MTRIARSIWIAWLLAAFAGTARAAPPVDRADAASPGGDHLFPSALRVSATAATGSPYVAIGEVALGFGPHAALGFVAGVTPRVAGLGLHPRFAFAITGDVRAIARVPVLYYPETNDAESWLLTRPSLVVETPIAADFRLYAGGGALWAECVDQLFGGEGRAHAHGHLEPVPSEEMPMGILFWTANAGAALALAPSLDAFVDLASVMEGLALAGPHWTDFGGPPLIAVLGATARF
jgi:hypothetical protein